MARKPKRIALVLPARREYTALLLRGFLAAIDDPRRQQFVEMPYDEGATPAGVRSIAVDGAVVWTDASHRWVLDWRDQGVKLVSCNSDWLPDRIPCVAAESDAALDGIVEHLATLAPTHAAYVGYRVAEGPSKQSHRDAFLARAAARGWDTSALEVPGIPPGQPHRLAAASAEKELVRFLRGLPKRTVVYCDDDYVAALVCSVARHIRRDVPEDLAVLGRHDVTMARFNVPTISSQPVPGEQVGATAMRILLDLLAGKPAPAAPVLIPMPGVIVRESTGGTTRRDDDVLRAHSLIERFACQGLTVDQLLRQVSLSQKTFNKRYEAAYGRTPGAAIRRVRAQRAKDWLTTTDLSVGRIADLCGFDESTNFVAFFRREVGCTPGEYRHRAR